ncbi:3781_t:CDS:2 [Paraglomus brasilianum]|uniref:3781_t:CDS:1 n=1 Tax=Paraglomus brasilianum TaxID=144538 RepID=A0A9N9B8X6_9GLOM|nr:3781_t:CDS:2 [Paraglomus brasilianum]
MSQLRVFVSGTYYSVARVIVQELYKRFGNTVAEVRLGFDKEQPTPFWSSRVSIICSIDSENKDTIREALKNVNAAFLWKAPGDPEDLLKSFVDVAEENGVQNLVILSTYHSYLASGQEIETYVSSKSIPRYTFLHVPFFTHHFDIYKNTIIKEKTLSLPIGTEASFAPLDDRDFAEVVVTLLLSPDDNLHNQTTYTLTGPKLYTGPELAERLSVIMNDHVKFFGTSLNEAEQQLSKLLPQANERVKQQHLELYRAIKSGECEVKTEDVKKILGDKKAPRDIEIYFGDIIVRITRGY